LRAIWRCWERGEPLRYEGQHYRFSLMTPEFSPPPAGLPPVPVTIAAVGPAMMRLAGRLCDGVRLHGFCTRRYLEEVALPQIHEGLARSGRSRETFQVWGGGFVATGKDDGAVAQMMDWVRYRIGFYGSTRTYAGVLSLHGWDELAAKLHQMSKRGQWQEMAKQVPDELVHTFAAVGRYDQIVGAIEKRFGGVSDAIALAFPPDTPAGRARELVQDVQRIPTAFRAFPNAW